MRCRDRATISCVSPVTRPCSCSGSPSVFVLLGVTATTIGSAVFRDKELLLRISGALVVAMALFLAGSLVLKRPGWYREIRFHPRLERYGPFAAPIAGAAFGFGWQPCLGPILASVSAVAASSGSAGQGAALLGVYSLGLGIPFLVVGLALGRLSGTISLVRRHSRLITIVSAVVMGAFGVLLFTDKLTYVTSELETLMRVDRSRPADNRRLKHRVTPSRASSRQRAGCLHATGMRPRPACRRAAPP